MCTLVCKKVRCIFWEKDRWKWNISLKRRLWKILMILEFFQQVKVILIWHNMSINPKLHIKKLTLIREPLFVRNFKTTYFIFNLCKMSYWLNSTIVFFKFWNPNLKTIGGIKSYWNHTKNLKLKDVHIWRINRLFKKNKSDN